MRNVLFVHGAWVGPRCWDAWVQLYKSEGIESSAPAWPFDERPYSQLRASPSPELASVGVTEIVEHYARIIQAMEQKPVLIGHSFGGLIVQLLVARGLGTAGIALDPAPPRGVLPTPRALWTALPVLATWQGWKRILHMTFDQFVAGFAHELPERERQRAYEEHVIPTPGRPYFQAAFSMFHRATELDFKRATRAPLLITSGERDRTAPPAMVRANHRAYRRSAARTDFHEFPKRSHWLIAEPGWEEVARHCLAWAKAATLMQDQAHDSTARAAQPVFSLLP
jgi:pimeloyl-ACP methyl ester carboxylesterase